MIYAFRHTHISAYVIGLLLGAIFAFAVAPTISTWDDIYWRYFDSWNPVASIEARKVPSPEGEVRAEFTVIRLRGEECETVKVGAIEELPGGNAVRVFAARTDGQPVMNVPVGVTYRSEWRFWPTGLGTLKVIVEYRCDGRIVRVPVKGLP